MASSSNYFYYLLRQQSQIQMPQRDGEVAAQGGHGAVVPDRRPTTALIGRAIRQRPTGTQTSVEK